MGADISFSHYYGQLARRAFKDWGHSLRNELYAHTVLSLLTWFLTRKDHDAWGILKAALEANGILLALVAIVHTLRAPWLRDVDQAKTINTIEGKLTVEEHKNQQPEIKGYIEKAFFDISYQPQFRGYTLALEVSLWNSRQVPTTLRNVTLTVIAKGSTVSTTKQQLQGVQNSATQIGPVRLEDLLSKISSQNTLRYNIHEKGWVVFYADALVVSNPGEPIAGVTLRLEFVDASGMVHVIEQICDVKRCNLQMVFPGNVLNQFRISS